MLKSSLLFQKNTNFTQVNNSRILGRRMRKCTNTNIQGDFQICISVPLSLPPPNNSTQWILVILKHDGTPQHAIKINTHPRTAQHTNVLPVMVISESQFTVLMEVCFNPIIYFPMIYATIWYFLPVNSQVIFTPSLPMYQHRSLISTHPPHIWSLSPGSTFSILYQYYVHQSLLYINPIFPHISY